MKTEKIEFALHDWMAELPFTQQALLLSIVRGPDGMPKYNTAKYLVYFLRGVIIKPAYDWEGTNNNDYMWGDYVEFDQFAEQFFNDVDAFPHHFLMHFFHCAEVVGYKHPDLEIAKNWRRFYECACKSLHMNPETMDQFNERLKK